MRAQNNEFFFVYNNILLVKIVSIHFFLVIIKNKHKNTFFYLLQLQSDFTSILSKLVADKVVNSEVFERAHTAFTTRWLELSKGICNVVDSAGSHDLKEFKKSLQNIIENGMS